MFVKTRCSKIIAHNGHKTKLLRQILSWLHCFTTTCVCADSLAKTQQRWTNMRSVGIGRIIRLPQLSFLSLLTLLAQVHHSLIWRRQDLPFELLWDTFGCFVVFLSTLRYFGPITSSCLIRRRQDLHWKRRVWAKLKFFSSLWVKLLHCNQRGKKSQQSKHKNSVQYTFQQVSLCVVGITPS